MNTAALVIFWLCVAAIVYTQFGYLFSLMLISKVRRYVPKKMDVYPTVTFIIPVYNEGRAVRRKIENTLALDYPRELIEIIIASDCSTDDTEDQCRGFDDVRFIQLDQRGGKPAALNAALEQASGRIIAFTDVGVILEPDSLAKAVRPFADPRVGCVSSEDIVVAKGGVGEAESLYLRVDTLIRRLESEVVSATGMSGSFHLVRRDLCPPFPLDLATDMFTALHCVSSGFKAVVEETSKVRIAAQSDPKREFGRKVRTMVTGLRAVKAFPHLLNAFRSGLYSWCLISHKILRYMTPLFVLFAAVSLIYLSLSNSVYFWVLIGGLALCGLSMLQIKARTITRLPGLVKAPGFFCVAVAAAAVGWYRFIRGDEFVTWQPTKRSMP